VAEKELLQPPLLESFDRLNDFWEQPSRSKILLMLSEGSGSAEFSASVSDNFLMVTYTCEKTLSTTEAVPFVRDSFPAEQ
jgi:hypothetical protein